MDQEKFLKLHLEMQQNNQEYKSYLDDMDSWSSEMKAKESRLIKDSNTNNSNYNSGHQIRNVTQKKIIKKPSKIKAYDYREWDKYDVDKALEESDNEELISDDSNLVISERHKERGNLFFKQCNYDAAIQEYSDAINLNLNNDILYSNRAMSLIKVKKYSEADVDCSTAINLNPKSVKAYYRRSQCRIFLNRKEEALNDLKAVVKLEPDNQQAKKNIYEIELELNVRGVVQPLSQPAKNRQSNNSLIRIDIQDVDPNKSFQNVSSDKLLTKESQQNLLQIEETKKVDTPEKIINTDVFKFRSPQTAVQLERDLCQFRSCRVHFTRYIDALQFSKLSRVIGHALDSEILALLITGLCLALEDRIFDEARFIDAMSMLGKTERFSSSWMMLADEITVLFNRTVASFDKTVLTSLPLCCATTK